MQIRKSEHSTKRQIYVALILAVLVFLIVLFFAKTDLRRRSSGKAARADKFQLV